MFLWQTAPNLQIYWYLSLHSCETHHEVRLSEEYVIEKSQGESFYFDKILLFPSLGGKVLSPWMTTQL